MQNICRDNLITTPQLFSETYLKHNRVTCYDETLFYEVSDSLTDTLEIITVSISGNLTNICGLFFSLVIIYSLNCVGYEEVDALRQQGGVLQPDDLGTTNEVTNTMIKFTFKLDENIKAKKQLLSGTVRRQPIEAFIPQIRIWQDKCTYYCLWTCSKEHIAHIVHYYP
jgi:hypothetical protein